MYILFWSQLRWPKCIKPSSFVDSTDLHRFRCVVHVSSVIHPCPPLYGQWSVGTTDQGLAARKTTSATSETLSQQRKCHVVLIIINITWFPWVTSLSQVSAAWRIPRLQCKVLSPYTPSPLAWQIWSPQDFELVHTQKIHNPTFLLAKNTTSYSCRNGTVIKNSLTAV